MLIRKAQVGDFVTIRYEGCEPTIIEIKEVRGPRLRLDFHAPREAGIEVTKSDPRLTPER